MEIELSVSCYGFAGSQWAQGRDRMYAMQTIEVDVEAQGFVPCVADTVLACAANPYDE